MIIAMTLQKHCESQVEFGKVLILQLNICDSLLSVVNLMLRLGQKNRVASGTLLEFAEDLPRPQLK